MTCFDTPTADAVNIHFQAFSFDFISVAFQWFLALNELGITSNTNVISVYLISFHFTNMGATAFWALHPQLTSIHTNILQRPK
jgi:hypothetical protein